MKDFYKVTVTVGSHQVEVHFDLDENELCYLARKAAKNQSQRARDGAVTARVVKRSAIPDQKQCEA